MKQSLQEEDWRTLQAAVHKMIPSFVIMGFSIEFEAMAKTLLEHLNTNRHAEQIASLVMQLDHICTQACGELEIELHALKNIQAITSK
jgi:hypothetical protein